MSKKINVVTMKTGQDPEFTTMEDNLEAMQEFVGGYIEHVSVTTEIDLWLNDEGKLNGLEPSLVLMHNGNPYDHVCGDVFFTSHDDEGNTTSLEEKHINELKERLRKRMLGNGKIVFALDIG